MAVNSAESFAELALFYQSPNTVEDKQLRKDFDPIAIASRRAEGQLELMVKRAAVVAIENIGVNFRINRLRASELGRAPSQTPFVNLEGIARDPLHWVESVTR